MLLHPGFRNYFSLWIDLMLICNRQAGIHVYVRLPIRHIPVVTKVISKYGASANFTNSFSDQNKAIVVLPFYIVCDNGIAFQCALPRHGDQIFQKYRKSLGMLIKIMSSIYLISGAIQPFRMNPKKLGCVCKSLVGQYGEKMLVVTDGCQRKSMPKEQRYLITADSMRFEKCNKSLDDRVRRGRQRFR